MSRVMSHLLSLRVASSITPSFSLTPLFTLHNYYCYVEVLYPLDTLTVQNIYSIEIPRTEIDRLWSISRVQGAAPPLPAVSALLRRARPARPVGPVRLYGCTASWPPDSHRVREEGTRWVINRENPHEADMGHWGSVPNDPGRQ